MSSTVLKPDQSIMSDRRFALTLGTTPNTSPMTEWMPKTAFLSLMKHEKLAKNQQMSNLTSSRLQAEYNRL